MDKFHQLPQVIQDTHKTIEWFIPQIEKLPRSRRFTLGERVESRLLELLELLIEAAYIRNKKPLLQQANLRIDLLRHLWRIAYHLENISLKQYEQGAKRLIELGMQTGGWLKSQQQGSPRGSR